MEETIFESYFEEWSKRILGSQFIEMCSEHMISLGYFSKQIKDRICIIDPKGENSCHPGTLVGWRFFNEIELYLTSQGFPWAELNEQSQDKTSRSFYLVGQLAKEVSEKIKK